MKELFYFLFFCAAVETFEAMATHKKCFFFLGHRHAIYEVILCIRIAPSFMAMLRRSCETSITEMSMHLAGSLLLQPNFEESKMEN